MRSLCSATRVWVPLATTRERPCASMEKENRQKIYKDVTVMRGEQASFSELRSVWTWAMDPVRKPSGK